MREILEHPHQPARHRLDVEAYYKMIEAGILGRNERVELIDGDVIDMNPIGSAHAAITNRLNRLLSRATDRRALVSVQNPLRLDAYSEPEPDLMVLRPRDDDYRASHPTAFDVLLLIEVSDTTLAYDRTTKLGLYARHGIPEVWIVDIFGTGVEVFRQPKEGAYSLGERRTSGGLSPSLVPGVTVDIAELLA